MDGVDSSARARSQAQRLALALGGSSLAYPPFLALHHTQHHTAYQRQAARFIRPLKGAAGRPGVAANCCHTAALRQLVVAATDITGQHCGKKLRAPCSCHQRCLQ